MGLLRNPEVRQAAYMLLFLWGISVAGGFLISTVCGIYMIAVGACFLFLFFILMRQRCKKIQDMVFLIDQILHGEELFDFAEFQEGELAILRDEIYKMTLRLKGQAEQLNQDKQFLADSLADISHQLKTPLTAMNLLAERLRACVGQGNGKQFLKEMQEQLKRIEWLVTVLLKLSRLDAGTIVFKTDQITAKELIKTAAEPFLIPMELKCQEFQILGQAESKFIGDVAWTAEAVGNIIKNCMEHTPKGGIIQVTVRENMLYLEVKIEDNGVGVPEEELPHLFERFYRGKNASSGSVGIGLALAKAVVAAQNGSIQAENKESGGMCFLLRFYKSVV